PKKITSRKKWARQARRPRQGTNHCCAALPLSAEGRREEKLRSLRGVDVQPSCCLRTLRSPPANRRAPTGCQSYCEHPISKPCLTIPRSRMTTKNRSWASPSRDPVLAPPPSPLQTAAGCAAPSPSRHVARSLLAGGGRPSGFRLVRRRSASHRGLAATGPFARG